MAPIPQLQSQLSSLYLPNTGPITAHFYHPRTGLMTLIQIFKILDLENPGETQERDQGLQRLLLNHVPGKGQELLNPNQSSQRMNKELLKTETDEGNVASSNGTSSSKVIDVLEPDDAQEETGKEEEQEEDNKENCKDDNEGKYEECDGMIDAQAAQKFENDSRSISSNTMMILKQQKRLTPITKILKDTYLKKFDNNSNLCAINREEEAENKKSSRMKIKDKILFKGLPKLNMDQNFCLRDELGNESLDDYERASSRQGFANFKYDKEWKKKFLIFKRIKVENLDKSYFEFDRIEISLNRTMEDVQFKINSAEQQIKESVAEQLELSINSCPSTNIKPKLFILPKMMINHQIQTLFKSISGRVVHIDRRRLEFINEFNCQRMI
ncbi:hypothetical protein PPACK8108_LOCUS1486 [Phakopsora pachyrhizi]|uniref:Uncharacterized protein n=1 Tax=Phakopsora pachyrhizi TaxID=170000 RepID=A0AAV0AJM9_PHAPC|nr:hypothetical protein PPACK8108_LOCUS1486 [Phakopsora pachyrhizi]